MTLWIILTVMTALAAVAMAAPFLRQKNAKDLQSKDLDVYRDQLKEIEREEKSGLIRRAEFEEARKEISRRLLAAEQTEKSAPRTKSMGDRTYAAIGVATAVALGSTILYANMGWPELPSQPAAYRTANAIPSESRATVGADARMQQESASTAAADGGGDASTPPVGTVDDMIGKLAKRLETKPDDPDGWRMLGWAYFSQDRFADSAAAYAKAIAQNPAIGALKTARGEALVRAGGGTVTEEAANLFDDAVKQDSKDPRARFFIGLKKEQTGNKQAALEDWISVLKDASPDEPWVSDLRQRTESLATELKVDISARLPPVVATQAPRGGILDELQAQGEGVPPPGDQGPSASEVQKAQEMTPQDRNAMIQGMVDGLQARLEKSPRDAEGWIKLMRSRKVLGDSSAAKVALEKALAAFADLTEDQTRLTAAAKELGLIE